jgi:hypothetical protein
MSTQEVILNFTHHPTDRLAVYLLQGNDMSVFIQGEQKSVVIKGYTHLTRHGRVLRFTATVTIDSVNYHGTEIEITLEEGQNPVFARGTLKYKPRN